MMVLFATGAAFLLMSAYGPLLVRIGDEYKGMTDFSDLNVMFPIALILIGNLAISEARQFKDRRIFSCLTGVYGLICLVSLFGFVSQISMRQFEFGSVGPVELIVSEQDLHWFPTSVRSSLQIKPEEWSSANWEDRQKDRYYSVQGAYIVLRVGKELRLGFPRERNPEARHRSPFRMCWSIPDADHITWRVIEPATEVAKTGKQ
jgi:hypothetical protein